MVFKLIFQARIDSQSTGGESTIPFPPRNGGRACKQVNYQVVVRLSDGSVNTRITLVLNHGPDGAVSTLHSTPISLVDPTTTLPSVMSGDSDATKMIGEWLHPILKIKHVNGAGNSLVWAVVEVYELRKAF